MFSPKTNRFRRTFLTGIHALNEEDDSELQNFLQTVKSADGPFEELLFEGKVDEALAVYRAHAPFGEIEVQKVPEILGQCLPKIIQYRLTKSTLQNLLGWVQEEVVPNLTSNEAHLSLNKITSGVALELALKVLSSDHGASSSAIIHSLELICTIARCSGKDNQLVILLDETLELYKTHELLRPSRVLLCYNKEDDDLTTSGFLNRHYADIESMLSRGQSNLEEELERHVLPWCKRFDLSVDDALFNFILNVDPECFLESPKLLKRIENCEKRSKATLLFLRKCSNPLSLQALESLELLKTETPDLYERELRSLKIRECALKYDENGVFNLAKHVRLLQEHICAIAASTSSLNAFERIMEDAYFVGSQVHALFVSNLALKLSISYADWGLAEERIKFCIGKLEDGNYKYTMLQELVQFCWLSCDEEDDDISTFCNWGLEFCRYISNNLEQSKCYLSIPTFEDRFKSLMNTDSSSILVSSSQASFSNQDFHNLEEEREFIWMCKESELSLGCDRLNDYALVQDVKEACEKSTKKSVETVRFRDCPNLLNAEQIIPQVLNALRTFRIRSFDECSSEMMRLISLLDSNGAGQTALRLRVHLRRYRNGLDEINQDDDEDHLIFRLSSASLGRKQLDEPLILGYLLSLKKKHSAMWLFKTEAKRLNDDILINPNFSMKTEQEDDFEEIVKVDYFRFERLSALGKRISQSFDDEDLLEEYSKKERLAGWFLRLQEMNVKFDRWNLIENNLDHVQNVGNELFDVLFNSLFDKNDVRTLKSFYEFFIPDRNAEEATVNSLIHFISSLNDRIPELIEKLIKWSKECEADLLVPKLDEIFLKDTSSLEKMRGMLDILLEISPSKQKYLHRLELLRFPELDFQKLLDNPYEELLSTSQRCSSELLKSVCSSGISLPSGFVHNYIIELIKQYPKSSFENEICPLLAADCPDKKNVALFAGENLCLTRDRLSSLKFVLSEFGMDQTLTKEIQLLQTQVIFEENDVDFEKAEILPENRSVAFQSHLINSKALTSTSSIIKIFYERTDFKIDSSRVYENAIILAKGSEKRLKMELQSCIIDWLHSGPLRSSSEAIEKENALTQHPALARQKEEDKRIQIIARAFEHGLGLDKGVASLRKMTSSAKYPNIAKARAYKVLKHFLKDLSEEDANNLWILERTIEFEYCKTICGDWRQTPDQIFSSKVDKKAAIEGLFRDAQNDDCLLFLARLVDHYQLYDDSGLLEKICCRLGEKNFQDVLDLLLGCPPQSLIFVENLQVWNVVFESHVLWLQKGRNVFETSKNSFYRMTLLLERCPFDALVKDTLDSILPLLSQQENAQYLIARMETLKARYQF